MVGRLANVLYWSACIFAAGWAAIFLSILSLDRHTQAEWLAGGAVAAGGALLLWIIGRACRYVLAGR